MTLSSVTFDRSLYNLLTPTRAAAAGHWVSLSAPLRLTFCPAGHWQFPFCSGHFFACVLLLGACGGVEARCCGEEMFLPTCEATPLQALQAKCFTRSFNGNPNSDSNPLTLNPTYPKAFAALLFRPCNWIKLIHHLT